MRIAVTFEDEMVFFSKTLQFTKCCAIMHTIFKICVRKVGACMNKHELAQKVIMNNGGIAKTVDFAASVLGG